MGAGGEIMEESGCCGGGEAKHSQNILTFIDGNTNSWTWASLVVFVLAINISVHLLKIDSLVRCDGR